MMNDDEKQLALITGASSGIGLELAKLFANGGYDLVIVSDDREKLEAAAWELRQITNSGSIHIIEADLSQLDSARKVYEQVRVTGRELDVLVNNAGVGVYGDFTRETDLDREIGMIQLNTIAVVQLTKLFAPQMVTRGSGRILITASVASLMPTPLLTVYGATKAFVYAFAQGLREELSDTGVTVTALLPVRPTQTSSSVRTRKRAGSWIRRSIPPAWRKRVTTR
jgi:short-subunit dehydrogenase